MLDIKQKLSILYNTSRRFCRKHKFYIRYCIRHPSPTKIASKAMQTLIHMYNCIVSYKFNRVNLCIMSIKEQNQLSLSQIICQQQGEKMSSSLVDCFSSYYIDKAVRSLQYLKKNNLFKLKEIHRCKNIFVSFSNHSDKKKIYGVKKGGNKTIV